MKILYIFFFNINSTQRKSVSSEIYVTYTCIKSLTPCCQCGYHVIKSIQCGVVSRKNHCHLTLQRNAMHIATDKYKVTLIYIAKDIFVS